MMTRILFLLLTFALPLSAQEGRLKDKVAIVIGASKGIGKATAEVFSEEGAQVILVARSEEILKANVDQMIQNGFRASYVCADVSNEEEMHLMAAEVVKRYGRIDILCQNAGIYPECRLEEMTAEKWDHVIGTNLRGTFFAVKACLDTMKAQHYGRIVLTSSISGPTVGLPGQSHYCASKAGMNGFMRTAAIELAKYNITVNAVEPGNVMTEGYADLGEEQEAAMTKAVPLGRLGTGRDIAYGLLFLASDEAGYITGQSLIIDGGQVLPESHFLEY